MGSFSTTKQKILIVDDDKTSLVVLQDIFREEYNINLAKTGNEALIMAAEYKPDLILLDIMMKGMDGFETCKQLKNNDETRRIPIIFVSAKTDEKAELRGFELGAVDYITKPFKIPIVQARVKTHLELKRHIEILESISRRDGLTGAYNRRQFDETLAEEWKRAQRHKRPFSVLLLDIDYFKNYNDMYGHLAGDECLKKITLVLKANLKRAGDFLARYGGEEFVVLLPETSQDKAEEVAERLRSAVEAQKTVHDDSSISDYVTVSIGIGTVVPDKNMDYIMLLEKTDSALYEAKQTGRNSIVTKKLYV